MTWHITTAYLFSIVIKKQSYKNISMHIQLLWQGPWPCAFKPYFVEYKAITLGIFGMKITKIKEATV